MNRFTSIAAAALLALPASLAAVAAATSFAVSPAYAGVAQIEMARLGAPVALRA